MLKNIFKRFNENEAGAISSEVVMWLVAGGFLSVAVMVFAGNGVEQLEEDSRYQLKAQEKVTTF